MSIWKSDVSDCGGGDLLSNAGIANRDHREFFFAGGGHQ